MLQHNCQREIANGIKLTFGLRMAMGAGES